MITITDKAKAALLERGASRGFVKVVVQAGGCAGMTYHAEIVDSRQQEDKIILKDKQLQVITNDQSLPYLFGLQIDYSEDLITAGFRFQTAGDKPSCGCGASFADPGNVSTFRIGGGCGY